MLRTCSKPAGNQLSPASCEDRTASHHTSGVPGRVYGGRGKEVRDGRVSLHGSAGAEVLFDLLSGGEGLHQAAVRLWAPRMCRAKALANPQFSEMRGRRKRLHFSGPKAIFIFHKAAPNLVQKRVP